MNRRRLLQGLAASAFGCAASSLPRRRSGLGAAALPLGATPESMFEVFLLGGLGPWESFYAVEEHGATGDPAGYWCFQKEGKPTLQQWLDRCVKDPRPLLQPFGLDANQARVNLGPFVYPLRDRPDLLKRMRVWVMQHPFEPHEAGIPLAMTGHARGNPRSAALGTHFNAFLADPGRPLPLAYTLMMSSFNVLAGNNTDAAGAVGLHAAAARPLAVRLPGSDLLDRLPRAAVGGHRVQLDALVDHYTRRRGARLLGTSGAPLRRPGLEDFAFARRVLAQVDALGELLPADVLGAELVQACSFNPSTPITVPVLDEVSTGMRVATRLITDPVWPARHVQLIDGGLWTDEEGIGYDSHSDHVERQGTNLVHSLKQLASQINEPGEADPRKLDLDRHFVLLNTEFGRGPRPERSVRNPKGTGSDHWPWGYVVVGLGGFIDESRAGVVGAIGPDFRATDYTTPTEHRAAMLLANGINPMHELAFAVGDVRGATTEEDALMILRERVLGF